MSAMMVLTFSNSDNALSNGSTTSSSISCGPAPGYTATTAKNGDSILGSSLRGMLSSALMPTRMAITNMMRVNW